MTAEEAENPLVRMERGVDEDGHGHVLWVLGTALLNQFLRDEKVGSAVDLSDEALRHLCHLASISDRNGIFDDSEKAEAQNVVGVFVGKDSGGNDVWVRSSEVGPELVRAFGPPVENKLDTLCDPSYNTVHFELRVFDTSPAAPTDPIQNVGICLLTRTLHPPNLV